MKVLTVIVNYRTGPHVLNALSSVVPQLRALGQSGVAVVDNQSPDDSLKVLREGIRARGYEDVVELLESPVNGGFGAGNNIAIRRALASEQPPEYVYLLNPDATADEGAIEALVGFLDKHPRVGIAGSYLHDPDGTPHCSAFRFPNLLSELERGMRLGMLSRALRDYTVYKPVPDYTGPADWVTGASMMLRRELLAEIGGFDETFFLYFEEVDLCLRARQAGWDVHFVREASVGHVGSVSTGVATDRRTPKFWFDSRKHYLQKHHGTPYLALANTVFAASFALQRARWVLQGKGPFEQPHLLRDFVRHNFFSEPLT